MTSGDSAATLETRPCDGPALAEGGGFRTDGAWLKPFDPALLDLIQRSPGDVRELLTRCAADRQIHNAASRPLRFVPPTALEAGCAYERHVYQEGAVPTRENLHDRLNALIWLHFPLSKARLNLLQASQIQKNGVGPQRGRLRDALTVFDESGLVLLSDDEELLDALRHFQWSRVFGTWRERFIHRTRVMVFGHGLLEQMTRPYKALTGHAKFLRMPVGLSLAEIDASLALELGPRLSAAELQPIPVMGIPGWFAENRQPDFYDDASVFRSGRSASKTL